MSIDFSQVYSNCLQGNVQSAIEILRRPKFRRSAKARSLLDRFQRRFIEGHNAPIKTHDPFVRSVITCYRNYYRQALMQRLEGSRADKSLLQQLMKSCKTHGIAASKIRTIDTMEKKLALTLANLNLFSLFGKILPHRSLLIWRKEKTKVYRIEIPEAIQKVKVVFMEDFIEESWMHFATFGRHYNGGWVTGGSEAQAVHCVARAYKQESDRFLSGFLTHEAQHFYDLKRYPKLSQADLEYRAKLAELIKSTRPNNRAAKFARQVDKNRSSPHAFASYCLMKNLTRLLMLSKKPYELRQWKSVSPSQLRSAAEELITDHSAILQKKGKSVIEVI